MTHFAPGYAKNVFPSKAVHTEGVGNICTTPSKGERSWSITNKYLSKNVVQIDINVENDVKTTII